MRFVLVTGPLGVGKTTVCKQLAMRYAEQNALLDGDDLGMTRPGGLTGKRLDLVERNLLTCAANFREWGAQYVFCSWVIANQFRLNRFQRRVIAAGFDFTCFALTAHDEVLFQRIEGRPEMRFIPSLENKAWLGDLNARVGRLRGCMQINTTGLDLFTVVDRVCSGLTAIRTSTTEFESGAPSRMPGLAWLTQRINLGAPN